jgi:hypothetical protein
LRRGRQGLDGGRCHQQTGDCSCREKQNSGSDQAAGHGDYPPATYLDIEDFAHGISTVAWPGLLIWITPPQLHISVEFESSAGMLPMSTVGAPGAQGAAVAGTQGIGVSTPSAAEVAEATTGFAIEEQEPKGGMLTMGA